MTTKHLLSLLSRHETLRTPANFRQMSHRVASDLVDAHFNPRHAERFLELAPWHQRQAMAALVIDACRAECEARGIPEPKGGIAQRIERCLTRIRANAETAQKEFDAALGGSATEPPQESVRCRA